MKRTSRLLVTLTVALLATTMYVAPVAATTYSAVGASTPAQYQFGDVISEAGDALSEVGESARDALRTRGEVRGKGKSELGDETAQELNDRIANSPLTNPGHTGTLSRAR